MQSWTNADEKNWLRCWQRRLPPSHRKTWWKAATTGHKQPITVELGPKIGFRQFQLGNAKRFLGADTQPTTLPRPPPSTTHPCSSHTTHTATSHTTPHTTHHYTPTYSWKTDEDVEKQADDDNFSGDIRFVRIGYCNRLGEIAKNNRNRPETGMMISWTFYRHWLDWIGPFLAHTANRTGKNFPRACWSCLNTSR